MIRPKVIAGCVLALVILALAWPPSIDPAIARAEETGYRAARSAIYHRQLAEVALDSLVSARLATNRTAEASRRRVDSAGAAASRFEGLPVLPPGSGSSLPVLGDVFPTDSLVAVRIARQRVQMVIDTANAAITSLQMAMELERGRASVAIQQFQATIVAQDTVIESYKVRLAAARKPWYVRAARGVEHGAAAAACGGAGYVLGGPLVGIGTGVACAAIAGVTR